MANNAITKNNGRVIFQPYFKARYQNMQNIITDTQILDFIPYQWKTYYIAYIRQWAQWVQGFVPQLHQRDFFSTGIGTSITELFVREIMSGGFRLDSKDKLTDIEIEEWGKRNGLDKIFNEMFFFSNGVGNAFLKLTPSGSEVYPSVYPSTRAFIIANRRQDITRAVFIDRFQANTVSKSDYWIKEDRVMFKGRPYYRIQIGQQSGVVTSPTWNFNNVSFERLDETVKENIFELYGDIVANKWYELPFRGLGVYNVPNKAVAVALSDIPAYSDSSLHTALDILYSIDFNYTSQQMDMYFGKAKVLVPSNMNPKIVTVSDGVSFSEIINSAPLEEDIFTKVEMSDEKQSPLFIHPDLRGEAHKFIRDADLELLAIKLGLSSTTLANHLAQNSAKTATQVDAEDDTTQKTVNNKRELANIGINKMLEDVAEFYEWSSVPDITWNRSSGMTAQENKQLLEEFNAGVLPIREYLKKRWRDLTDDEVEKWVLTIEENQAKNAYNSQFVDTLNGYEEE